MQRFILLSLNHGQGDNDISSGVFVSVYKFLCIFIAIVNKEKTN